MIEAMKHMYQLLLTEPHAPTLCERLERIAREAIAELESQEPVAWWNDTGTHIDLNVSGRGTPLYTHPPQRTWVGLTDVEIDQGLLRTNHALQTAGAWREGAEWATEQLKEKNT